jgi:hypothetical protein
LDHCLHDFNRDTDGNQDEVDSDSAKVLIGVTNLPSPVEILEDGHPDGNLDEFREKQERELQHIAQ